MLVRGVVSGKSRRSLGRLCGVAGAGLGGLWQTSGLENGRRQAHIIQMALALIKIASLAGLTVIMLGIVPDRRRGAIIAVGTCVVAALVLHFVAP